MGNSTAKKFFLFYFPFVKREIICSSKDCHLDHGLGISPIYYKHDPCSCFDLKQKNYVSSLYVQPDLLLSSVCQTIWTSKNLQYSGFANFIDEWSQCDFCFTNFGVILEYLESSITTNKAIFRLSSTWSWHVYTIVGGIHEVAVAVR